MMSLHNLYREQILDHAKQPRHHYAMKDALRVQERNPLCGDELCLYLKVAGERIEQVSFEACGCSISVASGSLLVESLQGQTIRKAEELANQLQRLFADKAEDHVVPEKWLGLMGVKQYPGRIKCAILPLNALQRALQLIASTDKTSAFVLP